MSVRERLYTRLGAPVPFDPGHTFVTSPFFSPRVLACVRLVIAFYTLFTLVFVLAWQAVKLDVADRFFSFFTELSLIGLCAYFWQSGIQTAVYAFGQQKGYPLQRWPRFLQFLHVLLFSTISTFPILVTIVFWAVLADSNSFKGAFAAFSNVSQHLLNAVFCLFEILFTHAGPTPWLHVPIVVVVLGSYLGVAYITHASQGFYTYSFLDPEKQHAALAGWVIGIAVAEALIFAVTRSVCVVREKIAARHGRGVSADGVRHRNPATSLSSERTDEWEEVERPESRLV